MPILVLVNEFDSDERSGSVENPEVGKLFLDVRNFVDKPATVVAGSALLCDKQTNKKHKMDVAVNCRFLGEDADWLIINKYLQKDLFVNVEYSTGGWYSYNLREQSAKFFLRTLDKVKIVKLITDYYDFNLDYNHFLIYCDFIKRQISQKYKGNESSEILSKIYEHFGNNLNEEVLFNVWKSKKFDLIFKNDALDYEIPERIFNSKIDELNINEIKRISSYSFGKSICEKYLTKSIENIENKKTEEILELYDILKSVDENTTFTKILDDIYFRRFSEEYKGNIKEYGIISDFEKFEEYNEVKYTISPKISSTEKENIINHINEVIIKNSDDRFKPELWLLGILENISFDNIEKLFFTSEASYEIKLEILSKIGHEYQLELFKKYSRNKSWIDAYKLLEEHVSKENSYAYNFKLSDVLFNTEFWNNSKSDKLVKSFIKYTEENADENEKYKLYLQGLYNDISEDCLKQKIDISDNDQCFFVFNNLKENQQLILEVLLYKIKEVESSVIEMIYYYSKKYLNNTNQTVLDTYIFENIENKEYYKIWKRGLANIFPEKYINEIIIIDYGDFNKFISKIPLNPNIAEVIFSYLLRETGVSDKFDFDRIYNHIKYLVSFEELYTEKIDEIKNSFYNLILWHFGFRKSFDFEILKNKFIYFSPEEQVIIIKKLFYHKAQNEFDLSIEKLKELARFDIDLYSISSEHNPYIDIDISTDVIIKSLISFKERKKFLLPTDLLNIVLNNLKFDKTKRFQLQEYFEKCDGRSKAKHIIDYDHVIEKKFFENNDFYYSIRFPVYKTYNVGFGNYSRELKEYNEDFEILRKAVKSITGRDWDESGEQWKVPSERGKEVMEFARKYKFFLNFEGDKYQNNLHLVELQKSDCPNGIKYCEGRLANKPDNNFNKKFWWCGGQKCFEKCETVHQAIDWEKYTLLDFCEILNLNTDETNKLGDFIPKGYYYQFIGLINRFNQLLERLYCDDCHEILYPVETSYYAKHNIVKFKCNNNNCKNKEEIYLNHCLNGQCNAIIDSRISKKCDNGLYICENCGSCCSQDLFKRRLNAMEIADNINNEKKEWIYNTLKEKYDNNKGHLDKGEYFCYKCGKTMQESQTDVFYCKDCKVEYDTYKYRFKRVNKHIELDSNIDDID